MDFAQRRIQNFNVLFKNYFVGSLWFVQEELIKERTQEVNIKYDQNSIRQGHPHLSIMQKRIVGLEKVPMLLGTHKKHSKRSIKIDAVLGEKYAHTWFGHLIIPYTPSDFLKNKIKNSFLNKKCLGDSEMGLLKQWMKEKGYKI